MGLIPIPHADLSDDDVAGALGRAVSLIDVILDVLAEADPLGLRRRTHDAGGGSGIVDKVLDLAAGLLDCADIPGTKAWEAKDRAARIQWWVHRVGAIDTVLVAFPGLLGVIAEYPDHAQTLLIEIIGAGPRAMVRRIVRGAGG